VKTILSQMPAWPQFMLGQDTLMIGYPWLALGAILTLERLLQPTWRVLELGSGGSTLFWARRCALVQSFETDSTWAERVREAVKGLKATVTYCATVAVIAEHVSTVAERSVDLLVIDHGDPERHARCKNPNRLPLATVALRTLKIGGWLLVDNYDCFGMERFDWGAFSTFTFDEAGGFNRSRKYSGRGTRLGQLERAA
jgi:hypothetical protein